MPTEVYDGCPEHGQVAYDPSEHDLEDGECPACNEVHEAGGDGTTCPDCGEEFVSHHAMRTHQGQAH